MFYNDNSADKSTSEKTGAAMTAAEKQQHYQITVDCWRLLLKYQEPVSAQEYWERLVEDARKIAERYEHLRFAEKTILAVLEEIDRIWRKKSGEINDRI